MRALVCGSPRGQLFNALLATVPDGVTLLQPEQRLDITDADAVSAWVAETTPDVIVNAAAYTAVDKAESEPDLAHAVNAQGPGHLAQAAKVNGAHLLHVSTDFVFGPSDGRPFTVDADCKPLGVYGQSKRDGELAVLQTLGERGLVMRTAWVYSSHGNNFVKTMLRLMAERDELGVVADQIGSPTATGPLAEALWHAAAQGHGGTFHWRGAGVASWYDLAVATQEEALALGLLERAIPIRPLKTEQYPTPAARPPYSVLDTSDSEARLGLSARHWRSELRDVLEELL